MNEVNNELAEVLQDQGIGGKHSNTPLSTEVSKGAQSCEWQAHSQCCNVEFRYAVQPVSVQFAYLRQDTPH